MESYSNLVGVSVATHHVLHAPEYVHPFSRWVWRLAPATTQDSLLRIVRIPVRIVGVPVRIGVGVRWSHHNTWGKAKPVDEPIDKRAMNEAGMPKRTMREAGSEPRITHKSGVSSKFTSRGGRACKERQCGKGCKENFDHT
jgi:hypothetical protein